MSCSTNRLLAAAALLGLLALCPPRPANAFELRLWPIADLSRDSTTTRLRLLGPIVEWQRDAGAASLTVRPLFHASRTSDGVRRGFALYPVASWHSSEDELFLRFFGLVSYQRSRRASAASPYTRQFTVFPLVFFRQGPESGTSLSILPFYADVGGVLGYERIRMFLFPLFLSLVEPLHERTWLPFPFVSWVGGKLGSGFRLWPVYGRTVVGDESKTSYVAWPLYVRHVDHPGHQGQVTSRLSWPFFSSIEGPALESRTYGYGIVLPLYTHTVNRKDDTETWSLAWPFWTWQRSRKTGERLSVRMTPFFQDRRTEGLRSVFYLWPLYRERTGLGASAGYRRRDVLLLLYRDQREGDGAGKLHTRVILPLWISRTGPDAGRAQAFTLLDGLFPKNESLETLYAPLYRLYGSEASAGRDRRDLLWRMLEWGDGKLRPPWYVSLH